MFVDKGIELRELFDRFHQARNDRRAGRLGELARFGLRPHHPHRVGRRADPDHAGGFDLLGKLGVFGQKTVARVEQLGAAGGRGLEQPVHIEVALRGRRRADGKALVRHQHVGREPIDLGVDGHRADAHFTARPNDPNRDLTTVGDEQLHSGMFPCFLAGIESLLVWSMANAEISFRRSTDGMMTSSI